MKPFSLHERSLFFIHDPAGVKLLTRLLLKFSHFNEQKFRHNCKVTVVAMCDCGIKTETRERFFLLSPFSIIEGQEFLNNVSKKYFSL